MFGEPFVICKLDCDEVLCDLCNEDYTESDVTGGILVGSYAICPKCVRNEMIPDLKAGESETFRDFVMRIRENDSRERI